MALSKILNASVTDSTLTTTKLATPNLGRRNLIINGNFQCWQRNTNVTGLGTASGYFTADRWRINLGGTSAGRFTMSRTAGDPDGFNYGLVINCTTADTSIAADEQLRLNYRIEGQDLQQLEKGTSTAKAVTISFYAKVDGSATNFVVELQDSDNTRTISKMFTFTNTWTRYYWTVPGDTTGALDQDNNMSMTLNFWLNAGSGHTSGTLNTSWNARTNANVAAGIHSLFASTSNEFYLAGVQLEVNSQATPFEHRSFGEELALCQRYYYRVQSSAEANIATGNAWDARSSDYSIRLPTTMRAAYTLGVSALTDILYKYGARSERSDGQYFQLTNSTALDIASINHQILTNSTTVGFATHLALKDANSYFDFDAEL
jgi:hypothetical protein